MSATMIKRRAHVKRLGMVVLLGLVLAAFSAPSISAKPANKVITTYYTDASKQHIVGERTLFCGGSVMMMGEKTPIKTSYLEPCSPHRTP